MDILRLHPSCLSESLPLSKSEVERACSLQPRLDQPCGSTGRISLRDTCKRVASSPIVFICFQWIMLLSYLPLLAAVHASLRQRGYLLCRRQSRAATAVPPTAAAALSFKPLPSSSMTSGYRYSG